MSTRSVEPGFCGNTVPSVGAAVLPGAGVSVASGGLVTETSGVSVGAAMEGSGVALPLSSPSQAMAKMLRPSIRKAAADFMDPSYRGACSPTAGTNPVPSERSRSRQPSDARIARLVPES